MINIFIPGHLYAFVTYLCDNISPVSLAKKCPLSTNFIPKLNLLSPFKFKRFSNFLTRNAVRKQANMPQSEKNMLVNGTIRKRDRTHTSIRHQKLNKISLCQGDDGKTKNDTMNYFTNQEPIRKPAHIVGAAILNK